MFDFKALSNPCGVLGPFVVEANEIFQASLSTNTWNSYETGMSAFNKFRKNKKMKKCVLLLTECLTLKSNRKQI
jgi:hypothetical protein